MDYVITYVNSLDKEWLKGCSGNKQNVNNPRFRDFGFLRYHLRMIEQNLSFIDNVFLVISSRTQIPKWLNTNKVRVVLHEDFIPREVLPTFNSSVIETFLCNIPNLSERFIYANDDMFTIRPLKEENFFSKEGKIVMKFKPLRKDLTSYFKSLCINSFKFVSDKKTIVQPYHFLSPIYTEHGKTIIKDKDLISTCSKYRDGENTKNLNQYIFTNYEYINGNSTEENLPKVKYKFIDNINIDDFNDCDMLCINDGTHELNINKIDMILNKFQDMFPNKSKYELNDYKDFYICSMIKDEHLYLDKWIEHHLKLGFTEIHLYEDDGSLSHKKITDKYPNVYLYKLSDYVDMNGLGKNAKRQYTLFNRFIKEHNQGWCLFIDIDEYFQLSNGYTLKDLTDEYYDVPAIKLEWKIFGANKHIDRPITGTVYDNYIEANNINQKVLGVTIKSFVNLSLRGNYFINGPHYCYGALYTNYSEDYIDMDKCWLDHFITMSFEDYYNRRIKRGCVTKNNRKLLFFFQINKNMIHLIPQIEEKYNIKI